MTTNLIQYTPRRLHLKVLQMETPALQELHEIVVAELRRREEKP